MKATEVIHIKRLIQALAIMCADSRSPADRRREYAPEGKDVYGNMDSHVLTRGVGTVLRSHNRIAERAGALAAKKRRKRKRKKENE